MNTKELIEKIEALPAHNARNRPWIDKKLVLGLVRELDEPKKVTVPKYVANWIANVKRNGFKFRNSSRFYEEIVSSDDVYRVMYYILRESIAGEVIRIWVNANRDAFARAWLDGYEVEKEKRYKVAIKGVSENNTLIYDKTEECWFFEDDNNEDPIYVYHTRKELEEAGFGWVFDCEGIEVEEVVE